ncbi:hypothetical protein [Geomesophilobacter sediminis]|uniref:Uncharacterized protein n=1 Tax=Geomesophilobacter sediminis TaxID=2798584 RepID=A0A8J7J7D0_9BACT|nr:hypothetical protein [Geomesophilobacter sediminis]MBJ6725066.1 hypothetical protein [Geomesophilobacter sediminis]
MNLLICIDDTDDLDTPGTGELAESIAAGITAAGWGTCGAVSRHQLLIHPEVPFTSHNSAMCFPAQISDHLLEAVTDYCVSVLLAQSAPVADPGLCVLVPERLPQPAALIEYGYRAKKVVLGKEEAYKTAAAQGIHLSEHGGTGQGVIGALAGAALRLTGNDGRLKGKLPIRSVHGIATVREICGCGIGQVRTVQGDVLADAERVLVGKWVKPVLLDHDIVVLVSETDGVAGASWIAADREIFQNY